MLHSHSHSPTLVLTLAHSHSCTHYPLSSLFVIAATEHAENDAIRRLSYRNKGQRANAPFWANLGVFTPGASCPMDTAAEIWTGTLLSSPFSSYLSLLFSLFINFLGMAWQIYSLSIQDLILLNYTQIAVEPEVLMRQVKTITTSHYGLIRYYFFLLFIYFLFDNCLFSHFFLRYVNRELSINRFGYKNIPVNPCTPGCYRPTPGATCVDNEPYTGTIFFIIYLRLNFNF
jgi:hypothetical protein